MKINKNNLLKLRRLLKNNNLKNNSCILLAMLVFISVSGMTSKRHDATEIYYEELLQESNNYTPDYNGIDELIKRIETVIDNNSNENNIEQKPVNNENLVEDQVEINNDEEFENEAQIEITNDEKIQIILERFNLTKEQFDTIVAIVLAEAKWDSYEDAYAVINTIYNRSISNSWINYVNHFVGKNTGTSLYYQSICPNQFVVYQHGNYLKFFNKDVSNELGYQAVIDFLFAGEIMHNFLSFVDSSYCASGEYIQFAENGGNCYYNELTVENISVENRIFTEEIKMQNVEAFKITVNENNREKVKVLK